MQIRLRNGNIEFLRASWDKESKRTRQKLIKETDFTEEERAEYEEWKAARKSVEREKSLDMMARNAAHFINEIAEAIEKGRKPENAATILAALDRLNLGLRKSGITRQKAKKSEGDAQDEKTA